MYNVYAAVITDANAILDGVITVGLLHTLCD